MIALLLHILLAVAFLVIAACLIVWVIQREPAGHGQHAGRRTMVLEYDDLPCFQPDPALAVATLHNPYLLSDIKAERQAGDMVLRAEGSPEQNTVSARLPGLVSDGPAATTLRMSADASTSRVGESHPRDWTPRPLSAVRDLAPWVRAALEHAAVDETAVDTRLGDDTRDAWQTGTADDPFEGFGSAEGWVKALFAGKVQVAA